MKEKGRETAKAQVFLSPGEAIYLTNGEVVSYPNDPKKWGDAEIEKFRLPCWCTFVWDEEEQEYVPESIVCVEHTLEFDGKLVCKKCGKETTKVANTAGEDPDNAICITCHKETCKKCKKKFSVNKLLIDSYTLHLFCPNCAKKHKPVGELRPYF